MNGKTRRDIIRNDTIRARDRVGVTLIIKKLVENRLRWFGQVERRGPIDVVVRRVDVTSRKMSDTRDEDKFKSK
jgi:hypothetical protein